MGMFDTMQQGKSVVGAQAGVTPNAAGQGFAQQVPAGVNTGNNFAQKQQMRANPIMKGKPNMMGKPAMGQAMGQPNPNAGMLNNAAQAAGGVMSGWMNRTPQSQSQQPNPMMGGANSLMRAINTNVGMGGPRKPIGGTMAGQLPQPLINTPPEGPSTQGYGRQAMSPGPNMNKLEPTGGVQMGAANDVGLTGPMNTQETPSNLAEGPFNQINGRIHDMGPNNIPGYGIGGSGFDQLMQRMGGGSQGMPGMSSLYGTTPQNTLQNTNGMTDIMNQPPMQQQPVVMDENGLEPRRGPR